MICKSPEHDVDNGLREVGEVALDVNNNPCEFVFLASKWLGKEYSLALCLDCIACSSV